MSKTCNWGIIGPGRIAHKFAQDLTGLKNARLHAVASRSLERAQAFAGEYGASHVFGSYEEILECPDLDIVYIATPHTGHCAYTIKCLEAGIPVLCEKPFAMNLAEADTMIDACKTAGVKLMYAEELCFTPKYVRLKGLLDEGALGDPVLIKQAEKHDGPHAPHFWDVEQSGGGVTMDMGCHAIEFFRWMIGRPKIKSVYAQMGTYLHTDKTRGDDDAIIILEFENGVVGMAEESWLKRGGMDDRAEVYGTKGHAFADVLDAFNTRANVVVMGSGDALRAANQEAGGDWLAVEKVM